MTITRSLLAVALLTAPASAQSWEAETLALHNKERAAFQVAPLAWDIGLARSADLYAQELARTGTWGHSPSDTRPGHGENLWMGTAGAYPIKAMVGGWIGERQWFQPGVFPAVSSTGQWSDVGHYTQMVASRTTRVGCAIRTGGGSNYLLCRYSPSGNVNGLPMP